jgi:hypothetical protein
MKYLLIAVAAYLALTTVRNAQQVAAWNACGPNNQTDACPQLAAWQKEWAWLPVPNFA